MHVTKHRTLALFTVLALAACSGKDGVTGQTGPAGATGATGAAGANGSKGDKGDKGDPGVAPLATTEACFGCHEAGLAAKHQLSDQLGVVVRPQHWSMTGAAVKVDHDSNSATPTIQLPAVTLEANGNATIRFHVDVNGVARNDFLLKAQDARNHNEDAYWVFNTTTGAGERPKIATANRCRRLARAKPRSTSFR